MLSAIDAPDAGTETAAPPLTPQLEKDEAVYATPLSPAAFCRLSPPLEEAGITVEEYLTTLGDDETKEGAADNKARADLRTAFGNSEGAGDKKVGSARSFLEAILPQIPSYAAENAQFAMTINHNWRCAVPAAKILYVQDDSIEYMLNLQTFEIAHKELMIVETDLGKATGAVTRASDQFKIDFHEPTMDNDAETKLGLQARVTNKHNLLKNITTQSAEASRKQVIAANDEDYDALGLEIKEKRAEYKQETARLAKLEKDIEDIKKGVDVELPVENPAARTRARMAAQKNLDELKQRKSELTSKAMQLNEIKNFAYARRKALAISDENVSMTPPKILTEVLDELPASLMLQRASSVALFDFRASKFRHPLDSFFIIIRHTTQKVAKTFTAGYGRMNDLNLLCTYMLATDRQSFKDQTALIHEGSNGAIFLNAIADLVNDASEFHMKAYGYTFTKFVFAYDEVAMKYTANEKAGRREVERNEFCEYVES